MFYLILIILQILLENAVSMEMFDNMDGEIARYFSDCPGTNNYTEIPQEELNYITIGVLEDGDVFNTKKTLYNYYQVKELANNPHADFTKPTVMFVSGYLDHPSLPVGNMMGYTYKELGYTVLLLNARVFANTDYVEASRNTRPVGKHTAEMLANLTSHGLDPKKLSLVGISLGGQAISFIGKYYKEITGKSISRITGLDPAGPCFRNLGPKDRLDQSDADFVDVVMTNIDGFGMATPMGHVNFFVNGGQLQPSSFLWMFCNGLCSHLRSYALWIASLLFPNNFVAMKCDSVKQARDGNCYDNKPLITNVLGLNTDMNIHGIFYLGTSNHFPYFLIEEGLKRANSIWKSLI